MRKLAALWCLLLTALCPAAYAAPMADEIKTLSVIADSSLALPITEIIQNYTRDNYQAVVASYVPVSRQEQAVLEGVGYDVLITARPKLLEILKQQGLVDIYTESVIASNHLVLVAAQKSEFQASLTHGFPSAAMIQHFQWQPALVIGNPQNLLQGTVARQTLRHYGVLADMEPYTIYEKDVSEIIRLIRQHNILGMLYESDVIAHKGLRIVDTVPQEAHAPIQYVAVVLAGDRMEQSREFIEYLKKSSTSQVFEAYGFGRP